VVVITTTGLKMELLDIKKIYLQESCESQERTQQILQRFPTAEKILVKNHWKIPELQDESLIESWNLVKKNILVIGNIKSFASTPNGRSTDFIAPSHSNGCALSCAYCYVGRRKGPSNPITVFSNIEDIIKAIDKHASVLPDKTPNQCDPVYWTYDIGCNNDASVDDLVSDNVKDLIDYFADSKNIKASFATKFVNNKLLNYNPKNKTRIRFSLMPENVRKVVDVRTSTTTQKIKAINDFHEAGYEVHLNFSPVILTETWEEDYAELFEEIFDNVSGSAYTNLKHEVIFLTHNEALHDLNLKWHPKAEDLLWRPDIQEPKFSLNGAKNIRYSNAYRYSSIYIFKTLINRYLPFTPIRYIF
jgi:spore photoproduct lyase